MRRDLLRKMIETGIMEAHTSYDYDGRVVTTNGEWFPARVMGPSIPQPCYEHGSPSRSEPSKPDWIDGYYNFHPAWFTSKTGRATKKGDNLWEIWYAGQAAELRIKK